MHHKNNPVAAEILVTLARFNATQLSGMHHALVHEQERSGAAWTLEWMLLPQMLVATAAALARTGTLLEPGNLSIQATS
jgi:3-carboxy-cis,cis-muconate cycloisomerase